MNPNIVPRFTEGPDLHFAGGPDEPLTDSEYDHPDFELPAPAIAGAVTGRGPVPSARTGSLCPCGQPCAVGSTGRALLVRNGNTYCLECFAAMLNPKETL